MKNIGDGYERFANKRKELFNQGIIGEKGGQWQFLQDYVTSVSIGGGILIGSSVNGWEVWKDSNGIKINHSLRLKNNIKEDN